jgi:hypothetical protein
MPLHENKLHWPSSTVPSGWHDDFIRLVYVLTDNTIYMYVADYYSHVPPQLEQGSHRRIDVTSAINMLGPIIIFMTSTYFFSICGKTRCVI